MPDDKRYSIESIKLDKNELKKEIKEKLFPGILDVFWKFSKIIGSHNIGNKKNINNENKNAVNIFLLLL